MSQFERFVGIDWSGADGEYQSGIQVAQFFHDAKAPELVTPPVGKKWSRQSALDYIVSLTDRRTLVGLDFAFSVPWSDSKNLLPVCLQGISAAHQLWAFVDDFCKAEQFFHAGPIWLSKESPFRPFIKHFRSYEDKYEGRLFSGGLLRRTEKAAKSAGLQPKCVYRMAGPQVGHGSFAGMRVLHALRHAPTGNIAAWPFDDIEGAKLVITEIYPAVFYRRAQRRRPSKAQMKNGSYIEMVGETLRAFGVGSAAHIPSSVDAIDAIVTAAGLRTLSRETSQFCIPAAYAREAAREGWIFGVSADAQ
jgi:hypothetical protein